MNAFRLWFYFRMGYSTYLALLLNFVQVLLLVALYTEKVPFLSSLRLYDIALILIPPSSLVSIALGYLHIRHQLKTDVMLQAVQNPYLFVAAPGRDQKVSIPYAILSLKVNRAQMESYGKMTPELDQEFSSVEKLLEKLLSGGEVR